MGDKMRFDKNLDPTWKLLYDNLWLLIYAEILAPDLFSIDAVMGLH